MPDLYPNKNETTLSGSLPNSEVCSPPSLNSSFLMAFKSSKHFKLESPAYSPVIQLHLSWPASLWMPGFLFFIFYIMVLRVSHSSWAKGPCTSPLNHCISCRSQSFFYPACITVAGSTNRRRRSGFCCSPLFRNIMKTTWWCSASIQALCFLLQHRYF